MTTDQPTSDPHPPSRSVKLLWAMAVVYGLWLIWLAYVAVVNVRSGNQ